MIKANVITKNTNWCRYIKNPNSYIDKKINKLNKKDIETYINKFNPIHSTAAFKYESGKDFLVRKLITDEPDLTGLIGLPLYYVKDIIKLIKDNSWS